MNRLKKWWKECLAGAATAGLVVAAIFSIQVNVPVVNSPHVEWQSNTLAVLIEPYASTTTAYIVEVGAGFVFDGASEPRAAWTELGLTPFSGVSLRASLTHDALYCSQWLPRTVADGIFREILLADGVQKDKAETMFRAVSDFGEVVWAKHSGTDVEVARIKVSVKKRF